MDDRSACTDRPRLNMELSLGGQRLSAAPIELLTPSNNASRLPKAAKTWLGACARAQSLLMDSGAGQLFDDEPLRIDIVGSLASSQNNLAFAVASATAAAAQALKAAATGLSLAGMERAASAVLSASEAAASASEHEPRARSTFSDGRRHATVRLPVLSHIFDASSGLAAKAPFWSSEEVGTYVVLHEAGHAAHMAGPGRSDLLLLGSAPSAAANQMMIHLGLDTTDSGPYGQLCFATLSESYADCFAAIALGAGHSDKATQACHRISSIREACFPKESSLYELGDYEHDTREALAELSSRIESNGVPQSGAQIHDLCSECARTGLLRWAQLLASNSTGPLTWGFWNQAGACLAMQRDPGAADAALAQAPELAHLASELPCFRILAKHLASDIAAGQCSPASAFGLGLLMRMDEIAGAPRLTLQGSMDAPSGVRAGKPRLNH